MFNKINKLFICLLMFAVVLIFSGCKKIEPKLDTLSAIMKRDKIIIGVRADAAPFGFRDNKGNLVGYDIDLARIITKSLLGDENKVEFVPVTASNRIMKLNSGEVDMLIAAMSITPHRQALMDFSVPYFIAGQAILVKESCEKAKLMDFKNSRLIIVFGSTSEENLRTNVPEVEIIGFRTYKEAFKAFKEGKAEGIIADDTILTGFAHNDSTVKLLPTRYSREPYAVAFREEKESKELIEKINYIVDYLNSTGGSRKLREKWEVD